ncbi:hypothetical protein JIX56_30970 [Streptomyces sp. CA-210063]|uniref:hypothetical protein n=1 Tax=Streptomyces sp. CA-210063 TaxID=2801029 RepID=UPI00214C3C4B|nr:hypothetical protein [Streptomyces sp. CA-210063]UUU33911.1 hypothetical protein JIX56_30970 [Streptomyces sp. CA-210063]
MAARDNSRRDAEYDDMAHGDVEHGDAGRADAGRGDAGHGDLGLGDAGRADLAHGDAEHGGAERGDAEHGDPAVDGVARGGLVFGDGVGRAGLDHEGGVGRAGLEHEGGVERAGLEHDRVQSAEDVRYDGPAYAGMDALMAALVDEPLPEDALRDSDFVASRDAAAADIALLREQLGLIGEALAGAGTANADAGAPPGRRVAARPGDAAGAETDPGQMSGPATAPVAEVRPLLPRPARARRALNIAFGTLAAAVAASMVFGVGWVFVQAGGGADTTSSSKSDSGYDSGADQQDGEVSGPHDDSGGKLSHLGYLACARLVVEGTVTDVEPVPGAGQYRIAVDVDRYYKPAEGADEVVFPMAEDVDPRLRRGDHVLIGISPGSAEPDLWTVGERKIADERAWIEEGLPAAARMPCE